MRLKTTKGKIVRFPALNSCAQLHSGCLRFCQLNFILKGSITYLWNLKSTAKNYIRSCKRIRFQHLCGRDLFAEFKSAFAGVYFIIREICSDCSEPAITIILDTKCILKDLLPYYDVVLIHSINIKNIYLLKCFEKHNNIF